MISPAASEARKATAPMMSSTSPTRFSLILDAIQAARSGLANVAAVSAVRMNVGAMVLTRMPCGPHSIAIDLVMPSTACFVAE